MRLFARNVASPMPPIPIAGEVQSDHVETNGLRFGDQGLQRMLSANISARIRETV